MKKSFVIGLTGLALFIGGLGFGVYEMTQNPEEYQKGASVTVVFDATKYSHATKDELLLNLGEPNGISEDVYFYDEMEFTVKNDTITKFKYLPTMAIPYKLQDDVFYMFGITPNRDTVKKIAGNGITYKFQSVASGIWEFEVYGVNEKEKTFDMVFITYQA